MVGWIPRMRARFLSSRVDKQGVDISVTVCLCVRVCSYG